MKLGSEETEKEIRKLDCVCSLVKGGKSIRDIIHEWRQ